MPTSVVSPLQSKSFAQSQGIISKSDRQAADCLAQMGNAFDLMRYNAPSQNMQEHKHLIRTIAILEKQERMLLNQLHANEQRVYVHDGAQQAMQQVLQSVQQ